MGTWRHVLTRGVEAVVLLAIGGIVGWWIGGIDRPADLSRFDTHVAAAHERFGVDAELIRAVIRAESSGRPDVVSHRGAVGLMQLMPGTAEQVAKELGMEAPGKAELMRPSTNITLGTAHLKKLLDRFDHDPVLACAAYNTGASRVSRWLRKAPDLSSAAVVERFGSMETRTYVVRVRRFLDAGGR